MRTIYIKPRPHEQPPVERVVTVRTESGVETVRLAVRKRSEVIDGVQYVTEYVQPEEE